MNGASYAYDAAGDVTYDGINHYLYDAEGRICAVQSYGGSLTGYVYDAAGIRVAKGSLSTFSCNFSSNGFQTTTSWVLGPGPEGSDQAQVTEYAVSAGGTSTWVHTNAFASGALLATYHDTDTYFALEDWLGTKRVEGAGVPTDRSSSVGRLCAGGCYSWFTSMPYGNGLTPGGNCIDATEQHFTGKEHDQESGNDYFEARYYSDVMGRFMSPDWSAKVAPVPYAKLDNPQSLNLYVYVSNNPLIHIDADGHIIDDSKLKDNKEYQAWKSNYLAQPGAHAQWDALNGNKDLTVTMNWSESGNSGVDTKTLAWDSKGNLTHADVMFSSKSVGVQDKARGYEYASTIRDPGKMQAYTISHELAHVEQYQTLSGRLSLMRSQSEFKFLGQKMDELGESKFKTDPEVRWATRRLLHENYEREYGADQRAREVLEGR